MLRQQYQSFNEPMDEAVDEPVIQQTSKPKVVLFGDSISSAVGYGQDSQADNRFGNNVADVVSSYLGVPVDNQAMGGITTKDALTGSSIPYLGQNLAIPYGTYEKYLQEQRPNVVILRLGAADAVRLNDPQQTISNLQKMIDLAKQYGANPVLIGVSPFAAGGDSRAGNIIEWSIDPYIASADQINLGIQQLAQQNQLPFVDVRRLEVPQGALIDGGHPTAEFGKQMADYIGQAVTSALPEFGGSAEKYQQFVQAAPAPSPLQQAASASDQASFASFDPTTLGSAQKYYVAPDLSEEAYLDAIQQYELQKEGLVQYTSNRFNRPARELNPRTYEEWVSQQYTQAGEAARKNEADAIEGKLVSQLLAGWEGLGDEVGIGSSGTPQAQIGGRVLNVVAQDFARKLREKGITDITQAKFDPGALAAWTAEGKGNVSLIATPDGRLIPVWGSSSDAAAVRGAALALALSFTGAGALIGSTITTSLGIAASAATNALIGNIVVNTALNGGDIGSAVKGAVASWAGAEVGGMVGNAAKTVFDSAEGIKLISNIANNATQAAIRGGDVESAILNTFVAGAVDFATAKIPGFNELPSSVKSTIRQSINAAVQGKDIDAGAMLANAAKEGLLSYGLSQIPQFNEADARTQSFVTTMLRSAIDGGDLSESAVKWAVGQAKQEFEKVIKAGPALDELKKAGIIKDASYFGLDDQQKELVDRLAAQKDPKAAAARYINEQTTTPEEIRQFYKQITGKDATDAEAELLSTYTGPDEATARIGLENQIRANIAADELRFEELNKVFTDPNATDQDLINVMAEYKITPSFIERVTGKKYDEVVRQLDARFMDQDEVTQAFRDARTAAGLEPRDPTPDEILRYVGSNAGVTSQIQADIDREATTFDASGYGSVKDAMAAAKAAGYNNFTAPDGKTYMVNSPSVSIQAGAFDGTKLGSVEEARQAALREGKQTFVGPDEQTYRVTEKAAGGADRVFDASGYDPANEQQKALAAYSAYKLGYKNIAFADGTVFELSDKVGQSVANYDKQVAEARRLATQSEQSRQNAFDGSKFSDKGTAAIAANSAGKSSFTFSDGKVYQLPENFAQLVMPDQTAAETKRLNEQNQVLVSDAKGRAKTSFDNAWRAVIPFADPPAEGSTLRNLVSSLIFTGGAGVNMGVIGAINGVASIKLGAEPTVGYAGPDVEDARRYGVVISPYDTPEQRAAKFRQLQELKDAGAKPLTVSNAPPIGRGNAWYDFAQQLKEIGAFNSPEAQASQRRISDFLKDVPAWEKPIALMAIANQGNWLGVTSYIAEELPEEIPALITGNVLGTAWKFGLTGKAAISAFLDTAQDSGRAFQYAYDESRSKGKDESQSKIDGAIAAGVTAATELLPDFLADRTLLKALQKEASGIAANVLTNYAKNTGVALGTSFVTEYISGGSNAAIMNKINYGDWKWDDAFTQATIEAFVGFGVSGTIMAGADVSRAIGYMKDGTVATVKDLLDRNPNVNYSTINRTDPIFDFNGNTLSLNQLSTVANVAVADPTFQVSNFVDTLSDMGRNGITPVNAVNLALSYTADPTSAAWKDVTPVGSVVAVNDNGTVTIRSNDGSQTTARTDVTLNVGDSVQVNPNTGLAVTSPAKVVSTDGNTATVQNRDGTTSTVTTTAPVTPGSQVNTNQATNTATPVDTTQAATGATAGAAASTTGTSAGVAGAQGQDAATVVATNTDGTKAVVQNPDGTTAVVDTPGGTKTGDAVVVDPTTNTATTVDATANTGTVIATSPDGTSAVVEKPDGSTTVVSTDGAATVGDTVNVNPVDNTATVTTPPANVADGVVADVNVTDGTATVISEDGTKTIVDTAGQDVQPGSVVSVNKDTATIVPPPRAGIEEPPVNPSATSQQELNAYVIDRFQSGATTPEIIRDLVGFGYHRDGFQTQRAFQALDSFRASQPVAPELQPGTTSVADIGGYIVRQLDSGKTLNQIKSDITNFGYNLSDPDVVRGLEVAQLKKPDSFPKAEDTLAAPEEQVEKYIIVNSFPNQGYAVAMNTLDQSRAVIKYQDGMQYGQEVNLGPKDIGILDPETYELKFGATTGRLAGVVSKNMDGTWTVIDSAQKQYNVSGLPAGLKPNDVVEVDPKTRTFISKPVAGNVAVSGDQAVNTNTGVTVNTETGVATNPNTNTGVDTNTGVVENNNTGVVVDTNTGTADNTNTNNQVDTNTGVATNQNTNTAVDTNTGTAVNSNTGVAVDTNTGVATNTNTNNSVDTNTGTAVNPNTNTTVDTNTGTAVNANTGVAVDTNTGVATNPNTNTAVDTNTGVATNPNTNTAVNTNTGTAVNANTGVAVDTNTGVATNPNTNTAVDTNTGVAVNPNTNTAVNTNTNTSTTVNPNTNTQTTTNTNTGTTTTVDPNTGTQTQVDPNTNTQTTVDPATNTQTTTDTSTGSQVRTNIDEPPPPPPPPPPTVVEDPRIKQLQDRIDQLVQAGIDREAATSGAMSELTGQLSTLTQAQTAQQKAAEDAAKEAARQQRIKSGLSVLDSPSGQYSPGDSPRVSPLESSGSSRFVSPLAAFMAQVAQGNYLPKQQAQTPMSSPQPQVDRFSYGKEPSIDQLLDPYGENAEEKIEAPFKAGGLASSPFASGTRYGRYAKGGLSIIEHSGKARVDFRHGDAVTGPGDGQSDDIPAMLADGEFVWPSDVVAALGNGSTKAGSDKLYQAMHAIRARARSTGPKDLPPPALKSPLDYLKTKKT